MESLTHTFSIKTLLILLKAGRRMTLEELSKEMGEQHGSVTHAVDAVREAGLVAAYARRGAPYEEEVYLTPVGRTVAEKLKEIEDLVGWTGQSGIS
jgi:DNA-binding transcriptional ArsR family regulator